MWRRRYLEAGEESKPTNVMPIEDLERRLLILIELMCVSTPNKREKLHDLVLQVKAANVKNSGVKKDIFLHLLKRYEKAVLKIFRTDNAASIKLLILTARLLNYRWAEYMTGSSIKRRQRTGVRWDDDEWGEVRLSVQALLNKMWRHIRTLHPIVNYSGKSSDWFLKRCGPISEERGTDNPVHITTGKKSEEWLKEVCISKVGEQKYNHESQEGIDGQVALLLYPMPFGNPKEPPKESEESSNTEEEE